jgi:hypothetical protein
MTAAELTRRRSPGRCWQSLSGEGTEIAPLIASNRPESRCNAVPSNAGCPYYPHAQGGHSRSTQGAKLSLTFILWQCIQRPTGRECPPRPIIELIEYETVASSRLLRPGDGGCEPPGVIPPGVQGVLSIARTGSASLGQPRSPRQGKKTTRQGSRAHSRAAQLTPGPTW